VAARRTLADADGRTLIPPPVAYGLAPGRVLRTFDRNGADVGSVALSPDGKVFAWACNGAGPLAVFLCDAATGKETARIPLSARTGHLLFTPDGKRLVVRAFDEKSLDFTLIGLPKG